MTASRPGDAPEVLIHRATPEDAEAFRACLDAVAREHRWLALVEAPPLDTVRGFLARLDVTGSVQYLAKAGERVVGWCDVCRKLHQGFRHSGELGMGLLREFRGQGIGARLLERTLATAAEQEMWRVELEVYASNRAAIRLYERHGFVFEGRKRRARIFEDQVDDIVCMARLTG